MYCGCGGNEHNAFSLKAKTRTRIIFKLKLYKPCLIDN